MMVPAPFIARSHRPGLFRLLAVSLCLLASSLPGIARGPEPVLRIPLEPLGFQQLSQQFRLSGATNLTLHYVDDEHLLVTFTVRRLLKRFADCPPGDDDRNIDALLLELPSGRVLARTAWRVHDHSQYLWDVGHGHFLLRIRDNLHMFAPLANLQAKEPFRLTPFLASKRHIGAVMLSPGADLLTIETTDPPAIDQATNSSNAPGTPITSGLSATAEGQTDSSRAVQINFFRIVMRSDEELSVHPAGITGARIPLLIPANAAGYLAVLDQGHQSWAFDFNMYTGKVNELAPFDSTCHPVPFFVSRSEFVAFGCTGGHERRIFAGFNMRGEEMWQQTLFESYILPTFVFAPASGRFAFSRIITSSSIETEALPPELLSRQNLTVYQTDSGARLLSIDCTPIQRAGQNFSLSPDGMNLALIHEQEIEIYRLPPLSGKDQAGLQRALASAPESNDAPILIGRSRDDAANSVVTDWSAALTAPTGAVAPPESQPSIPRVPDPPATLDPSAGRNPATATTDAPSGPPASVPVPETPAAQQSSAAPSDASATLPAVPSDTETPDDTPRKPPSLYAPSDPKPPSPKN